MGDVVRPDIEQNYLNKAPMTGITALLECKS